MPRKTDSNDPADWLVLAESDLTGIRDLIHRQLAPHLCRSKLAEILEKVLKAELLRCGWFLEKTHALVRLLELIEQYSPDLLPAAEPLALALAEAYFTERYPGFDLEEPDWVELESQAEDIGALLLTVKSRVVKK